MSKKALIVCTSTKSVGRRSADTGVWLDECAAPYYVFQEAGFSVDIASCQGGAIPVDDASTSGDSNTEECKRFVADKAAQKKFKKSLVVSEDLAKEYDIVFFSGGHGTMHDFPDMGGVATAAFSAGRVVAAVCHGPAIFIKCGFVSGKKVTAFSDKEEGVVKDMRKDLKIPFSLEASLKKAGAEYSCGPDWAPHTVADGRLVTGQNPASSTATAKLAVKAASGKKEMAKKQEAKKKKTIASYINLTSIAFAAAAWYFYSVGGNMYRLFNQDFSYDENDGNLHLFYPTWARGEKYSIFVLASDKANWHWDPTRKDKYKGETQGLILREEGIPQPDSREWNINVSSSLLNKPRDNNGTLFAHVFLTKDGFGPSRYFSSELRADPDASYTLFPLTELKWFDPNSTRSLLDSEASEEGTSSGTSSGQEAAALAEADEGTGSVVAHFRTIMSVQVVDLFDPLPYHKITGDIAPLLKLRRSQGPHELMYGPAVEIDSTWIKSNQVIPINKTSAVLPLQITVAPVHLGWIRLSKQMEQSFKLLASVGGTEDTEMDQMRELFNDTDPMLLIVTMIVSVFHMLFDFLAFKNDVQFWNSRKNFAGLSAKTLVINLVSQTIILLYLMDNDASVLVLITSGLAILIDVWKILRISRMGCQRNGFSLSLTWGQKSKIESETDSIDKKAQKYMMMILMPLVVCTAGYSLFHYEYKSWYSWLLSSFASAMYVGGFVMMTPQLFINYKMKSVSHLPWRVFIYKALNTFIDDLFAFIITMPTMHRLSVFRDDIVFFVYLYQRWIYPVDKRRIEGVDGEEEVEDQGGAGVGDDLQAKKEQ